MRQAYIEKDLSPARLAIINQAATICVQYAAQGFTLTVRQLFYQFVSRDLMPNTVQNYKRLADIVVDGRLCGMLDWDWIEDRLRVVADLAHWADPQEIMGAVSSQFRTDKWDQQPFRPIVMIEKDALAGVIEPTCNRLDVPYLACRGYVSVSAMRDVAQRLLGFINAGQEPVILHLGDHDPSGIDMSRDIQARLELFLGTSIEFERLALNMDQVDQYNPPPNPARQTDARYAGYLKTFGNESWELDALEPTVIAALVESAILRYRNEDRWDESVESERTQKRQLALVTRKWNAVAEYAEKLEA